MMRTTVLTAVLLTTLSFTVTAAEQPKAPPALTAPITAGFKVEKGFLAASGLQGWVLQSPSGEYNVFYTTADGQTMMAGALVTATGENLTQKYTEQYVPKPDLSALYDKLEKSNYVAAGTLKNPKSVIYAILDPNCVYCHYLWVALQPYEAAGLQVRWVPVAFLREDSMNQAAALLKGGEAVLREQQSEYGTPASPKGIEVTPDMKIKLEENQAIMREAQMNGTPGIFYKDGAGNVIAKNGMPPLKDLPAITKLPEQEQNDPRIARFK